MLKNLNLTKIVPPDRFCRGGGGHFCRNRTYSIEELINKNLHAQSRLVRFEERALTRQDQSSSSGVVLYETLCP